MVLFSVVKPERSSAPRASLAWEALILGLRSTAWKCKVLDELLVITSRLFQRDVLRFHQQGSGAPPMQVLGRLSC